MQIIGSDNRERLRRPPWAVFGAASQVGVNLKQGYNGDLTSKQAGSIGGQMVRKMIEAYENGLK